MCRSKLVRSRFTPHCRLVQGRYLPDDTVQFGRASRLSSSGVPFAGLQPVPGGRNWAAIQPPLQKDDSTLRLAYSALELSPWAMPAHAVGNPGRPGRADWPRPRCGSYVPCAGPGPRRPIGGRPPGLFFFRRSQL
ncbi:unnamed protein product, partial [Danaus chrysippus]